MLLVAAPIIIHLINRMRYRRVRFAAMEFLLSSQKKNRRRVLIEQLLLLLMRVLMVLIVVALIARLIIDPNQLSLFQGAKSHHVVILDDSVSMQDRLAEGTVFDEAKGVIRRLVAEGAKTPRSQVFTLILMSDPEKTLSGLSETDITEDLLVELSERLDVLAATHQAVDPAKALQRAQERLAEDRSAVRQIHVISDFRNSDWIDNKSAASVLTSLSKANIKLNLVKCASESHENLSVTELGGRVEVAAAGVPVTLEATIRNWGTRVAEDVRADLFINGSRLPRTIDFQTIPAGESITRSFDVVFPTAEPHQVKLTIREDSLEADNQRFLAIDVPEQNPVLIIDGSPATEQAFYVADALAANTSVTGFATSIQTPEDLRRTPLENYDLVYLINVPELAPDAVAALEDYVQGGGGLVWYLGDAVRPAFYNEKVFNPESGLFPVRIGAAPRLTDRPVSAATVQPDLVPGDHPIFKLFSNVDVPIYDLIFVNLAYPLAEKLESQANITKDVNVLATLRQDQPLILEHQYGKGKIVTCLTAAGPLMNPEGVIWTNWANGPGSFSFAVFQLELAKHLVRSDRTLPQLESGKPLAINLNQAFYAPDVEVISPNDQINRIQATPSSSEDDGEEGAADVPTIDVVYKETDQPGIYELVLSTTEQQRERRLYAVNVPADEGSLAIMNDEALLQELGPDVDIEIQQAGSFDWIRNESPGSEVRWLLLIVLALLCIAEPMLASRLSYVT
ncbi:hypothetical protein Mal48_26920 [Thalassoglobus polymorphus]|uniref:VWFA domain-containing protein n=2 Tax=Thalassoglobus polymorphus TaxID=2527994 RepID=A0A517QP81_9PLAN|nr:hypothetical protein Mal48_26920 [Thalassoglobus polymorphus]